MAFLLAKLVWLTLLYSEFAPCQLTFLEVYGS
jgi:hypothetical protein